MSLDAEVEIPGPLIKVLDVLRTHPAGLVTDIDGTISAIAPTPAEAVVTPEARDALARLATRLALVGVVTGRSAEVGEAMVGVPGLIYIGNHGMERRRSGATWQHPIAVASATAIGEALREVASGAAQTGIAEYLVVEDKKLSGSIHYRLAPDPEIALSMLRPLVAGAAVRYGLLVTEGRFILELRPSLRVNKGTAVTELVEEHGLKGLVFLGDDLTDVDAFRAVRTMREARLIAGLAVGVLAAETRPEVTAECDVTVPSVASCVGLLKAAADALT
jgi:trehalose 6-phosphate phosphatase